MKKMENNFAVSGFVAVDAQVNNFEKASVARFPLSINRKETVNGTEVRKSVLMNIEAWRSKEHTADFEVMKKGNLVTVEGYFKPEEYIKEGKTIQKLVFAATKVYMTPEKE